MKENIISPVFRTLDKENARSIFGAYRKEAPANQVSEPALFFVAPHVQMPAATLRRRYAQTKASL